MLTPEANHLDHVRPDPRCPWCRLRIVRPLEIKRLATRAQAIVERA